MLISKVINYLAGTVFIKISGVIPEKFINLCISQHIFLWDINKSQEDIYAYIRLHDFFRIRPLVKKSRTKVKVIAYKGLPFCIKKIKRRKMFVAGALLFIFLLYFLSSFIWFIDIIGLKNLNNDKITKIVYSCGLKPGTPKELINIKRIENEILLDNPEIAWVGINFTGTRAVIEIVERTVIRQEDKKPAHVIANKDGVVTEVITIVGQSNVKKGDTVKKGDLLIRGDVNAADQPVRAKGIIKARVWYESYGEGYLIKTEYQRTGRQEISVMLKLGSNEIMLKKDNEKVFDKSETEVIHKTLPWWRNRDLNVESIINIRYELTPVYYQQSLEQAKDEARAKAMQAMQNLVPEQAYILTRNIDILKTTEENLIRVKASVEAIEDIGQTVTITQ
jgi:similar to stage IV sporulation protein